jgi:hypothetical protein
VEYWHQACNHVQPFIGFAALAKPKSRKIIKFLIFLINFIFYTLKKKAPGANFLAPPLLMVLWKKKSGQ